METGPTFYLVIRVAGRSSRFRGKDLRFPVIFKIVNIGPVPEIELPHPALHSSALPTELILPRETHQADDFKLGIIYCI